MTVIGLHTGEHLTNNDNGKQKLFFITSLGPAVFNRRENQDSINNFRLVDGTWFFPFLEYFKWGVGCGVSI